MPLHSSESFIIYPNSVPRDESLIWGSLLDGIIVDNNEYLTILLYDNYGNLINDTTLSLNISVTPENNSISSQTTSLHQFSCSIQYNIFICPITLNITGTATITVIQEEIFHNFPSILQGDLESRLFTRYTTIKAGDSICKSLIVDEGYVPSSAGPEFVLLRFQYYDKYSNIPVIPVAETEQAIVFYDNQPATCYETESIGSMHCAIPTFTKGYHVVLIKCQNDIVYKRVLSLDCYDSSINANMTTETSDDELSLFFDLYDIYNNQCTHHLPSLYTIIRDLNNNYTRQVTLSFDFYKQKYAYIFSPEHTTSYEITLYNHGKLVFTTIIPYVTSYDKPVTFDNDMKFLGEGMNGGFIYTPLNIYIAMNTKYPVIVEYEFVDSNNQKITADINFTLNNMIYTFFIYTFMYIYVPSTSPFFSEVSLCMYISDNQSIVEKHMNPTFYTFDECSFSNRTFQEYATHTGSASFYLQTYIHYIRYTNSQDYFSDLSQEEVDERINRGEATNIYLKRTDQCINVDNITDYSSPSASSSPLIYAGEGRYVVDMQHLSTQDYFVSVFLQSSNMNAVFMISSQYHVVNRMSLEFLSNYESIVYLIDEPITIQFRIRTLYSNQYVTDETAVNESVHASVFQAHVVLYHSIYINEEEQLLKITFTPIYRHDVTDENANTVVLISVDSLAYYLYIRTTSIVPSIHYEILSTVVFQVIFEEASIPTVSTSTSTITTTSNIKSSPTISISLLNSSITTNNSRSKMNINQTIINNNDTNKSIDNENNRRNSLHYTNLFVVSPRTPKKSTIQLVRLVFGITMDVTPTNSERWFEAFGLYGHIHKDVITGVTFTDSTILIACIIIFINDIIYMITYYDFYNTEATKREYLTSLYIDEKTEYNRKYPSLSTKELSLLRTNILALYVLIYTKDNFIKPECITDLYAYLTANSPTPSALSPLLSIAALFNNESPAVRCALWTHLQRLCTLEDNSKCQSIGSRYIYTILNRSISIPLSIQEYDTIINFALSSNDRTSCTIKFPWLFFYIWKQLLISPCSLRLKHLNLIASLFTGDHAEENFKQLSSIPCFYIYIFTLSHITSTSSESNSRGNESENHRTLYDYNNIIINNRNDLEKKKEAIDCLFALNTEESQGLLIKYFKDPQINEDIRDYILDIMAIKNADDVMSMLLEKCIVIHGYLNNHIYSIPSLMIYIQLLNHLCKNLKENLSKMKMSPIIANNIKSLTQYICYIFKKNDIFNASIFTSLSDIYIYITSYITAKDNYNTEFTVPEDKFVVSLKTSILHPCGSLHDYLTLCLCKMTFNMKNNIHNDTVILDTIIYIIQRMELNTSSTTNNASTPAVIPVIGRNEGEQLFISFLLFTLNEYRNFYSSKNHQMGPYIYKHMNSLLRSPVENEQDMNILVHSDTIMNNVNIYNQYTAIYLARMEKYIDLYIEHFEKATKKIEQTITSSTLPTLSPSTQTNNDVYFRSREQEKDKLYIYKLLELLTYIYYTNILYKQNSWEYRSLSSHGNINGTHLIEDLNFGGKNYEDHARRGKSIKEKEKDDYMKKIQGLLNKVQSKKQNELDDDHDAEDDELEALQEAVPSILSIYEARYKEENQDSDVPRSPASRPLSGGLKGLFGKKKKEVLSPVPTSPITHTYTFSVSSLSFDTILPSLDSLHFYTLQEFSNHMQTNGQEKEQIPMDLEENSIVYSSPSKYIYMSFEVIGTIYINKNQLEFEGTSIRHLGSSSEKTLPSYMSSLSKQLLIKQSFSLALVTYIFRRKYLYQDIAIEFYFADGSSIYLVMNDNQEREDFYYTVKKYTSVRLFRSPINKRLYSSSSLLSSLPITQKWVDRQITTYDYLIALNIFAGRSFNNLAQYPVFPWIFKDYTSATLDLSNPNVYRDLSKPIGALNPDRLESFKERYEVMKEMYASDDGSSVNSVPFLYGTHYSSAGYTLFYLVREEPYTLLHIYLQSGVFDEAERLFTSVEGCFQSAMNSNGDVKELTPEWYYLPSFLVNQNKLPLGTKQDGTASSPEQFIYFQREGLESTYTDMHIAQWIDLIFGYKQKGVAAEESDNIFFSLIYEDNVNVDSLMNPLDKEAVLIQVAKFGQCPSQLFTTQHPSRVELPLAPTSPATVSTVSLFSPLKEDVVSIYINSKTKHLYGIDRSGKICDYIYKYDGMNDIKSNVYLATEDRKKAIQEHKFVTMYSAPHFIPVDNKHTYILQTGYVDNSMRITAVNSIFSKDNSVKDMILYNNTDIVTCASIDRDIDFLTSSEGSDIYMVVGSNDCSLSLYIYPGTYTGILSSLYNINNYTPLLQSPLCVKYIDSPVNGVDLCCKLDIFAGVGDNSKLYLYTIKEMEFLREIDINDSKKQIEELFGHSIKSLYIQKVKLILMNYHINGNFLNVVRLEEDEEDVMTDLCINMKGNKIITADMRCIAIRDVFSLQIINYDV
ncbi:hypothetical protein WA158_004262 [Blastocystis sp. Blastoise]